MKKRIFSLLVLLFAVSLAWAQCDQIKQIEKGLFNRKVYTLCKIELNDAQLVNLFLEDELFGDVFKPMAINYIVSTLFYTTGSALVLYPVGESIFSDGDPNWNLAYVGAGLIAVSIPFKIWYKKRAAEAVARYNMIYGYTGSLNFNIKASPNSIGLVMNF